jgi:hypothetical protein
MKSNIILGALICGAFLFNVPHTFGQFDAIKKRLGEKVEKALSGKGNGVLDNAVSMFEKKQPISTTFDDAIYEADILADFEPEEDEYQPLDIQPKAENGGYRLQSGLYSMNAKSFCLKGYTYGPSKGDGHLYAPLKGKKAGFVQTIIERYGQKPQTPQQDVQVLLWAIIAGADMNTLGTQHAKTLNTLFSTQELLTYKGKDWLSGVAEKEVFNLKQTLLGKVSPQLEKLIEADNKIKSMVRENKTFQEIEKIAVIAGVAPRDMVREVSKGRWSYHPNGYFVRFFPNGYSQTRVDVYVPFNDAVQTDSKGKAVALNNDARQLKEVIFNPSTMVASPANRPSQRIGVTPVPTDDINCWEAWVSKIPFNETSIENPIEDVDCSKSKVAWVVDNKLLACNPFEGRGFENIQFGNTYNKNSSNYHCYYVENTICDTTKCKNCTEEYVYKLMLESVQYAAPTDFKTSVSNCAITDVNIPCLEYNPIVTTVHPNMKAIINYTVSYQEMKYGRGGFVYPFTHSHFLHPGKVQRKVFTDGVKIKVATMGEGSGWLPENNLIYAKRTWGAVDNRIIGAFKCN